jgi:hypothetical protein
MLSNYFSEAAMGDLLQPWHLIVLSVLGLPFVAVFWALPLWFICKKAGFSPWLTLVNCVPLGTTFLLYMLAIADWKPVDEPNPSRSGQSVA